MRTKFIQYEELLKREQSLNQLRKKGFKLIYRKNYFKVVVGVVCLSVAIIPNGTGIFLYPLGFYLLEFNKMDLFRYKENLLRKFKEVLK